MARISWSLRCAASSSSDIAPPSAGSSSGSALSLYAMLAFQLLGHGFEAMLERAEADFLEIFGKACLEETHNALQRLTVAKRGIFQNDRLDHGLGTLNACFALAHTTHPTFILIGLDVARSWCPTAK